jgi:hypothetical protein
MRCLFPAPVGNDSVSINGREEKDLRNRREVCT